MGATDKFQGTGVFSGIKMEREPKALEEDKKNKAKDPKAKKEEKAKEKKLQSSK